MSMRPQPETADQTPRPRSGTPHDVEIKLDFAATQIEQAKIVFGLDDQPEQRRISFSEVINGLDGRNALPLLGRGVVLRFREKRMSDATLKLRAPGGAINAAAWKRVPRTWAKPPSSKATGPVTDA